MPPNDKPSATKIFSNHVIFFPSSTNQSLHIIRRRSQWRKRIRALIYTFVDTCKRTLYAQDTGLEYSHLSLSLPHFVLFILFLFSFSFIFPYVVFCLFIGLYVSLLFNTVSHVMLQFLQNCILLFPSLSFSKSLFLSLCVCVCVCVWVIVGVIWRVCVCR